MAETLKHILERPPCCLCRNENCKLVPNIPIVIPQFGCIYLSKSDIPIVIPETNASISLGQDKRKENSVFMYSILKNLIETQKT